jgi:probable phosphoglycerate mutase
VPIETDERLMEIDLGAWQGQNEFEIKERDPGKYDACWNRPASYESVGGECFLDVANRVGAF